LSSSASSLPAGTWEPRGSVTSPSYYDPDDDSTTPRTKTYTLFIRVG